jgi:peptidyl-dipeptidase A
MPESLAGFLRSYEERAIPLNRETNLAYWAATTTGRSEDQAACAAKIAAWRKLHSDHGEYARLKRWQEAGEAGDPLERRQLEILVRLYTEQQLAPDTIEELARREQEISSVFTSFRPEFEGRAASENDLRRVLASEKDAGRRREAWLAAKRIGAEVAPLLRALAERRNRAARSLGFRDFFHLRLTLDELPEEPLLRLLDELERRTAEPYLRVKAALDAGLARRFGLSPQALRPWHYPDPFFQDAPPVEGLDPDRLFSGLDVVEASRSFYAGLGLPVEDILARSDLFERPGKNQHAYCIDIDRKGDVRVLANVRSEERWMSTLLHELGHAVYSKHHDRELPFLLRDAAHMFTTEAVAMFMGRLTSNPGWLARQAGVPEREAREISGLLAEHLRLGELIFVRWGLVMVRFERELYRDPDQDLNALWWDLVRRLQQLTPPEGRDEPDYASKIHLGTTPVYYQNYLLGALTASQLREALEAAGAASEGLVGDRIAGELLRRRVFEVGARYPWEEMLRLATGHPLSVEPFLKEFAA